MEMFIMYSRIFFLPKNCNSSVGIWLWFRMFEFRLFSYKF